MKKQKGITLIALIITIIVMLILVGVSVSVALNTGLFKTAQGVAKNTEAERMNETAISNGVISIDGVVGETNIKEYADGLIKGTEDPEDPTEDPIEGTQWELTEDKDENGVLSVGDLVTHKEKTTETFYVIGFSADNTRVNLLASYVLKKEGTEITLKQDTTGANNPCVDTSAGYAAIAYGESLEAEKGRLMTIDEVDKLGGNSSEYSTSECLDFINTQVFWLGTYDSEGNVWQVNGPADIVWTTWGEELENEPGARPVVEVLLSSIN